jgi:hypothetical protein
MTRYLLMQMNGGRGSQTPVVSPAAISALQAPAVAAEVFGPEAAYGMGWVSGLLDDIPAVYHSGEEPGFHSFMLIEPDTHRGAVLLMNAHSPLADTLVFERMQRDLAQSLAGRHPSGAGVTLGAVYMAVDGVSLALTIIAVLLILRLPFSCRGERRYVPGLMGARLVGVLELGVGLLGLISVPISLGFPWSWLVRNASDIGLGLLMPLAFLILDGGLRLVSLVVSRRRSARPYTD